MSNVSYASDCLLCVCFRVIGRQAREKEYLILLLHITSLSGYSYIEQFAHEI